MDVQTCPKCHGLCRVSMTGNAFPVLLGGPLATGEQVCPVCQGAGSVVVLVTPRGTHLIPANGGTT